MMELQELLRKVRRIEIRTKVLSQEIFAGQYHSAFKGQGMTFSEVREYTYGDDIRTIDWKVTARFNHPYVKVFEEERELTVLLMIDVSGSEDFGSVRSKREYIAELAGVLAFAANENNDKVGVIFFTDKVEKFIPPKKGRRHTLRIIREILSFKPENKLTNIQNAVKFLINAIKKSAVVFLISDFLIGDPTLKEDLIEFEELSKVLAIASKKHDLIGIKINDPLEEVVPKLGLVNVVDSETGEQVWVDTYSETVRDKLEFFFKAHNEHIKRIFSRYGIDLVQLYTNQDYVVPLIQLFKKRG